MVETTDEVFADKGFLQAIAEEHRVSKAELEALKIALQGDTAEEIAGQLGISAAAVRKRLGAIYQKFQIPGTTPGKLESLKSILLDKYATTQRTPVEPSGVDWGEAISANVFYNRERERDTLKKFIVSDRCRLVAILGIGGIGKTNLSVKVAEDVQTDFDCLIWRSLREAPTLHQILEDWFQVLPGRAPERALETSGQKITHLLDILKQFRCLLVLDNFESILARKTRVGKYRDGYEDYGELLRRLGESKHKSCLMLTSREKPIEITALETDRQRTRTILLGGSEGTALAILKDKGLTGEDAEKKRLVKRYDGNPLALKIIATAIKDLFDGDIAHFLAQQDGEVDTSQQFVVVGDLRQLLDDQVSRLSNLEKTILYWLAICREPVTLAELRQDVFIPTTSPSKFLDALEYLSRRSLIEQVGGAFTLPNVVMEYATDSLVETVCHEIQSNQLDVFNSHALLKANAKDYIRAAQDRLILEPIARNLQLLIGSHSFRAWVEQTLDHLRAEASLSQGYAAGNLLNLLIKLETPLIGYDFSRLSIRHANLQTARLRQINFSDANMRDCRFSETFGSVLSMAFSADGKYLAAGAADSVIRLWRIRGNQPVHSFVGHSDWIWCIAYDSDHNRLASGSADGEVRLWDIKTGTCLWTFARHQARVWHVSFHRQGQILASGSDDGEVCLWSIKEKRKLTVIPSQGGAVRSIALSPDGWMVARGSYTGMVTLWDIKAAQPIIEVSAHQGRVLAMAFSADGQLLASADEYGTIKIWETVTWSCLNTLSSEPERVRSIAFSPEGTALVSGHDDGKVRLWSQVHVLDQGQVSRTLKDPSNTSWIWSVAFSPDGKMIASGGEDQAVRLWDAYKGRCLSTLQGRSNRILAIALSPRDNLLASGSEDRSVQLWGFQPPRVENQLLGHTNRVRAVAFSPDGNYLASSSDDQTVKVWDLRTGECLYTLAAHQDWVRTIAFSPDGQLIASGSDDHCIRIWRLADGQCINRLTDHSGCVLSLVFGSKPAYLVSGSEDKTIKLWNIHTGECEKTLAEHSSWVTSLAISPDGTQLASAGADKQIYISNLDNWQLVQILSGHTASVRSVAFNREGQLLASGSDDKTVRLWDIASGQCRHTLYGHNRWVSAVVFRATDDTLFSSGDQSIRRWDSQTGDRLEVLPLVKPYEGVKISGVNGLTQAQIVNLKTLGAVNTQM